ncbi:MAG: 3-hydroxyacyl-CoA dehydrogenase NAD-binding domain-containing protein [Acidobacteriota bacterium]
MASLFTLTVEQGVAWVVLDEPGRPINTLGTRGLTDFAALLDRLESEPALRGVALMSAKPTTFLAGADLDELDTLESAAQATEWVERGQALLERWERLSVPTVAAIRGAALGGGCEVALACTWRVAADHPATSLGLPEVQLGLIPALGGTYRLPRAVGLERAVEMLLSGRRLAVYEALRAGLVDEVVSEPALRQAALRRIGMGRRPAVRRFRDFLLGGNPLGRALFFRAARSRVRRRTGGRYPAPPRILEAVEAGARGGAKAAFAAEARHFGELALSPESRRLIAIFRASRELGAADGERATREPAAREAAAREPGLVGVLGAGFMGSGIAAAAARSGHHVRMIDNRPEALAKGLAFVRQRAESAGRRGGRSGRAEVERVFARVSPSTSLCGFQRAELVVEAVVEDLETKRAVLREIEPQLALACVLASNTSTIPIAELARGLRHPNRVLGLHFFSPVHRMPLVEIVRHPGTADPFVTRAQAFVRGLGKTPIVVRDGPGFYTSRILAPYLAEGAHLLLEGCGIREIDMAGRAAGFPVGPLELLDEVGIDIAAHAARTLAAAFPERMSDPREFKRLVEEGRLGRKVGQGFYDYKGKRKRPDDWVVEVLGARRSAAKPSPQEQRDRLLLAMVAEAVRCLEDGILESPRDGDIGAIFGLGFPPFLGGPFRYLDSLGAEVAVKRLEELASRRGAVFTPPAQLREMAGRGGRFYR